jgi:hypothetical protein
LQDFSDLFSSLSSFCSEKQSVVIFLQNNNELRPSGGFLGSYAKVESDHCSLSKIDFQSIYNLDGQLKDKILSPSPLFHLSDKLYLRDSGWFTDGPSNGNIISTFYEKEGGQTPDLMIFVTPSVVTNILKKIGGVEIDGQVLTSENFVEQIQAMTSSDSDFERNNPKAVLTQIFPKLLKKISDADSQTKIQTLTGIVNDLYSKQIWFYSRRKDLQDSFKALGVDASVKQTEGDYLQITSANMSGTKTDLDIQSSVALTTVYNLTEKNIENTLSFTKFNPLPKQSQFKNISFVRFSVPKGSVLVSSEGFLKTTEPGIDSNGYQQLESIIKWQANYKKLENGVWVGEESGKSVIAGFIETPGESTSKVTISYKLPKQQFDSKTYKMFIQKQPGANDYKFEHAIKNSGSEFIWPVEVAGKKETLLKDIIQSDKFYGYILKSN